MRLSPLVLTAALLAGEAEARKKDAHLVSYGGYATLDVAVVRGRVARGKVGADEPGASRGRKVWGTAKTFLARDVEDARLRIVHEGRAAKVVADDDGFFEARLPGPFMAGRRRFQVLLEERSWDAPPLEVELDVVDPRLGFVIITDIDDTIIESGVTGSKAAMIKRVAASDARDIRALDGAAQALATFAAEGVPVVYLSASPIELGARLMQFLALRGFPPGALFLRHYEEEGIGNPTAYKRARFEKVLKDFPGRKVILFGDNGEKDPEIFGALAKDTGRVALGYIRRTLPGQGGEARYQGMFVFGSWSEVVPHARVSGLLAAGSVAGP
jgi:phosphatidate phosphatase APP1